MPFYDYQCDKCGKIKEIQRKMIEDIKVYCDDCNSELRQKIGIDLSVRCRWDELPDNPAISREDLMDPTKY